MAIINLKQGEEAYGLAVMIADLVKQNIEHNPYKENFLKRINRTIGIKAKDIDLCVTLDFRKNRLDIYNDLVKNPSLVIITDSDTILELSLLHIKWGLPYFFDEEGLKILKKFFKKELVIEGLLFGLLPLINLTKLFSVH